MVSFNSIAVILLTTGASIISAAPAPPTQERCPPMAPPAEFISALPQIKADEQKLLQGQQSIAANWVNAVNQAIKDAATAITAASGIKATITVPVNFHAACSTKKANQLDDATLQRQFVVLRDAYAPYGINLYLNSTDRIVNDAIAKGPNFSSEHPAYLRRTRLGGYNALNMYFYSDWTQYLGYCNFPTTAATANSADFWEDGCHVDGGTVPGGERKRYDLGYTAVHEAGHWFGLYHVFQGGSCSTGNGDEVADTPWQSTPTGGCPTNADSCPNQAGMDSIHNYMDYSDDSW